jgi:hypothetical protein
MEDDEIGAIESGLVLLVQILYLIALLCSDPLLSHLQTPKWDTNRDSHVLIEATKKHHLNEIHKIFQECPSSAEISDLLSITTYV